MRLKTAIYFMGIPLAILWLFIEITGFTFLLWGLLISGLVLFGAMITSATREALNSHSPYEQYVARHNAGVMAARAEEARRSITQAEILEAQRELEKEAHDSDD